jgi:hypothetical protein
MSGVLAGWRAAEGGLAIFRSAMVVDREMIASINKAIGNEGCLDTKALRAL